MNTKKLIFLIFFLSFFLSQTVNGITHSVEDETVIQQLVYNSCNENNLCEAELNETIYTCPHDCHQGNGDPAVWQANAEAEGGPIEIFDITITVADGRKVTITWQTNKSTNAVLILEDGLGQTEGIYSEELFTLFHSIQTKELDLGKAYYFKIFAEGVYGDNNYETASLYLMEPTKIEDDFPDSFEEVEDTERQETDEIVISPEKSPSYIIQEIEDELEKWSGTIPTSLSGLSETKSSGFDDNFFLKSKKFFLNWWFQLMLLLGIIHFIYLTFR